MTAPTPEARPRRFPIQMGDFSLTYAVTTCNRLQFLKQSMPRLIAARQPDEEIVVIDGGSSDGSVDFLSELRDSGQIDVFINEADHGQGHGINKALLHARGTLIKPIN